MAIRIYIYINNYLKHKVNYLYASTERHRLAEWIQKQQLYISVYKRSTLDLGAYADWNWGDRRKNAIKMEIKRKLEKQYSYQPK